MWIAMVWIIVGLICFFSWVVGWVDEGGENTMRWVENRC